METGWTRDPWIEFVGQILIPEERRKSNPTEEEILTRLRKFPVGLIALLHERFQNFQSSRHQLVDAELEERCNLQSIFCHSERALQEAVGAFRRVLNGRWGKCRDCGEPIPEQRLNAHLVADLCYACASNTNGGPRATRTRRRR